jgi:hypothetical protein
MNKFVQYSKIAGIRERQLELSKKIKSDVVIHDQKLDLVMELQRLKELKAHEEKELVKKDQRYQGKVVITDQIKERETKRVLAKELLEKERLVMVKKTADLVEEEKINLEEKRVANDILSKQVTVFNKYNEGNKQRKKQDEKNLDIRMLQYQMDLAKKEEQELEEKR